MKLHLMLKALIVLMLLVLHPLPDPHLVVAQDADLNEGEDRPVVLSLRDVLNAALEHNLDIAVRRYDPRRSDTRITFSQSSFDPLLTSSAISGVDQRAQITDIGTVNVFDSTFHDYRIGFEDPLLLGGKYRIELITNDNFRITSALGGAVLVTNSQYLADLEFTFNQPLLRNLGPEVNRWQIVVARNDLGVSESRFKQTVIDTLAGSEKAYWDLNFALMELETQRSALNLAKEFLEQTRIKVRVGTLAPIEITQAEADVADREEKVIVAENQLLGAEDELRRVMNVPHDSPWWMRPIRPSDAPQIHEVTLDENTEVAAARENRPDLVQERLDLRSRETELSYRKNQRRWDLNFEGKYRPGGADNSSYGATFDSLRDGDLQSWSLLLNLSVPIGNRRAIADFVDAEHALNQSQFELQRLEQSARIEVRNAVRDVRTNIKRVHATSENSRLQREKLAAEKKKFDNGMSTPFQVLTFQDDVVEAVTGHNRAIVDLNKSLVELERVKGTLIASKDILLDDGESYGSGAAYAGTLRGLWKSGSTPSLASVPKVGTDAVETVILPTDFVFTRGGIKGIGGSQVFESGTPAGR